MKILKFIGGILFIGLLAALFLYRFQLATPKSRSRTGPHRVPKQNIPGVREVAADPSKLMTTALDPEKAMAYAKSLQAEVDKKNRETEAKIREMEQGY